MIFLLLIIVCFLKKLYKFSAFYTNAQILRQKFFRYSMSYHHSAIIDEHFFYEYSCFYKKQNKIVKIMNKRLW